MVVDYEKLVAEVRSVAVLAWSVDMPVERIRAHVLAILPTAGMTPEVAAFVKDLAESTINQALAPEEGDDREGTQAENLARPERCDCRGGPVQRRSEETGQGGAV